MSRIASVLTASLVVLSLLGFLGCAEKPPAEEGPPLVVATTGMVADLAAAIGGDAVRVEGLMGPGIDPHLFKASASDVGRLADAKLILYNGLHLEGKMGEILEKMARTRPVVAVTEGVAKERLLVPPEFEGEPDPHLWFDVALWSETIDVALRELVKVVPEEEAALRARAETLRAEWQELDAWVRGRVAEVPEGSRVLVTAHDAFGYFGAAYGFEVVGLQGLSTVTEASLQDLGRVVDVVTERKIKAIFVESSVPRRSIEAVQSGCAERGHEVVVGGELFSDAMGAPGTPEGTYPGMVRHNVDTIVDALK